MIYESIAVTSDITEFRWTTQGSKKAPSSRKGWVGSLLGQVIFYSHLHDGQGIRQAVWQVNH